ncbi:uncharacterized protein LOC114467847 [Gouania willdenowi]|uniref:uncharacterized protein LOC114467847 n=1 Tax=Gouania willdenowi TaxID=441366 RepID=UPI0010559920|nr:uncharacterized protein LOC114467847 [Gouania willdenowi]
MEENLPGGSSHGELLHVKTEAVEEKPSASAPCGESACFGAEQTVEELHTVHTGSTTTPVLLYPVGSDRFFTASGDGKTYLTIAPASVMPPVLSEKTLSAGSDFSSKAVLCLIEAVGRRWGLYETRERSQLFQSVQEEMASKGHLLPVEKIRRKWNNLIVTYKRVKDRSRETGHAKTSWEFFELMDATLCSTIGSQIINNKRNKSLSTVSSPTLPLPKITVKSPLQTPVVRPKEDAASSGCVESAGQGPPQCQILSSSAPSTSVASPTISTATAAEFKPLVLVNGEIATSSFHSTSMAPASSFISSPCFTDTPSTSSFLGSNSNADFHTLGYTSCKAHSFTSGVTPYRLSVAPPTHNQSLHSLSSVPSISPCLSPCGAPSASVTSLLESEVLSQKENNQESSPALFQKKLKGQEEQAYLERMAQRRAEAREKRRERREVRMSESLGRIATALELLSSKQDTVIALLQRLADRK